MCLDQNISFASDELLISMDNMSFVYQLCFGNTLSVQQLNRSLQLIVDKHLSLRTSVIFDKEEAALIQRIVELYANNNGLFTFTESTFDTDEQLDDIIYNEKHNFQLFNLAQGLVFRYHLVYYKNISADGLLSDQDVIIFNFHHAVFDRPSMDVFLHDLNQAYMTGQLPVDDKSSLRYLDCE